MEAPCVQVLGMIDENAIRARYAAIKDQLDERGRRLFVATEKAAAGYGGTAAVSRATGVARSTIIRGAKDLLAAPAAPVRVRRKGAGRPALEHGRSHRAGGPAPAWWNRRPWAIRCARCLWVSKSREKLATALRALNHAVSANTVGKMLTTLGYSRQVNRKTKEGSHHPDRDAQFQHINARSRVQAAGQPVISVDTKKKELIGEYKNGGSDYRAAGCPDEVKVHDFVDKELGKVAPYGIYDLATNTGWVSVGIDHDTAEFAVNSIRRWHEVVGRVRYRNRGPVADHRRWRRFEWIAGAVVEARIAETGRRDRTDLAGVPLSAGDIEVEQDRASHVLPHHPELARQAAHQPSRRRRTDRRHHDQNRPDGPLRTG